MMASVTLGAVFPPRSPIETLPVFAERVDALNLDELWLVEDCFEHGGISAAAVALATMRRACVGIGLLPAALRNPALAAMELGTLANLYPGRLRVAFGHGVESWMQQIGARAPNRVRLLHDVVDVVDRLLHGIEVTASTDYVSMERVSLDQPPEHPPSLLIGTTGPQSIAVAGTLGVGLLLPEGAGPAAVSWARQQLPRKCPLTVYTWLRIEDDEQQALRALAPYLGDWSRTGLYPRLATLAALPSSGEIELEALPRIAVVGTAIQCARAVAALRDAGATAIVFVPATERPLEMLERFAEDVVPLLLAAQLAP
jgi:5,10-methylenetetrahydromethanopterin reductase